MKVLNIQPANQKVGGLNYLYLWTYILYFFYWTSFFPYFFLSLLTFVIKKSVYVLDSSLVGFTQTSYCFLYIDRLILWGAEFPGCNMFNFH